MLRLWAYLEEPVRKMPTWQPLPRKLKIIPVRGGDDLVSAEQVTMLGEREDRPTEDEWAFLVKRLTIVHPKWVELMTTAGAQNSGPIPPEEQTNFRSASALFAALKLNQRVTLQQVIERIATALATSPDPGLDGIILARIAARADILVTPGFRFLCRDKLWRPASDGLIVEASNEVAELLPDAWIHQYVLHSDYTEGLASSKKALWAQWAVRCGLSRFAFPVERANRSRMRSEVGKFFKGRGGGSPAFPYANSDQFRFKDFDFAAELWAHWEALAHKRPEVWALVAKWIADTWSPIWEERLNATVFQRRGSVDKAITGGQLVAAWLHRLKSLPCLPDTYGKSHLPGELFRSTAETAPLINVETFVHPDWDRPTTVKLLDLLGVNSAPTSADKFVERLRALAHAPEPPKQSLIELYRVLDRLLARLDAAQLESSKAEFHQGRLIYAEDGTWQEAGSVFQRNDADIPGVVLVMSEVSELPLWDRLEVPKYPTLELALNWLKRLPDQERPRGPDETRARRILQHSPDRVWSECRHWLDLSARWVPADQLRYVARSQAIGQGLFPHIRQATADLTMLDDRAARVAIAADLATLDSILENRISRIEPAEAAASPKWIAALGCGLMQVDWPAVDTSNGEECLRLAATLAETRWQLVHELEIAPFLDGVPAGEGRPAKSYWDGVTLYSMGDGPRYHHDLTETVARRFDSPRLRRAIADCVNREPEWIADYLAANFDLLPEPVQLAPEPEATALMSGGSASAGLALGAAQAVSTDETAGADLDIVQLEVTGELGGEEEITKGNGAGRSPIGKKELFTEFMRLNGFTFNSQHGYYTNGNGHTVRKSHAVFDWELYEADGTIAHFYWVSTRTLEKRVEMPAEALEAMRRAANISWMILPDHDDRPKAHSWAEIEQRILLNQIETFPATMRLLLRADD